MSGPIPAGSPRVSAKTRGKGRATARYLTSTIEPVFLLAAEREHLDPLRGDLRVGQLTDRGVVQDLAQRRGEIGGSLDDLFAHGDIAQGTRESQPGVATLE